MTTIRQLSEDWHISKQAINKQMDSNFRQQFVVKNGNKLSINDNGVAVLAKHFNKKINADSKPKIVSKTTSNDTVLKQLEIKDEQIKMLQIALDQQQKLTLQANNQIESLQKKLLLPTENISSEPKETSTEKKKRHWWQFKN